MLTRPCLININNNSRCCGYYKYMDCRQNRLNMSTRSVSAEADGRGWRALLMAALLALSGCGGGGGGGGDSTHLDDWDTQSKEFYAVTTADLNGDEASDIVFTNAVTSLKISCNYKAGDFNCKSKERVNYYVVVYLQESLNPGNFMSDKKYELAGASHSIAVGDLNQDGIPDLAAAQLEDGTIRLFSGDGGVPGSFLSSVDFTAAMPARCIAVGDLNGDDLNDMAVAGNDVVLLENDPAAPGSNFGFRLLGVENATCVAFADINGDRRNDLVVTGATGVGVALQEQPPVVPGTFRPVTWYAAGSGAVDVAVADLNSDSLPDLAVANSGDAIGSVSVHLQDSLNAGEFLPAMFYPAGVNSSGVAIGNLNNDFLPDLAVANNDPAGGSVSVLLQLSTGNGTFAAAVDYPGVDGPDDIAIDELNGDGYADLTVADNSTMPKGPPYILVQDAVNPGNYFSRTQLP